VISEPVFVAIIFGAVASSVILGPWLAYSIKRRPQISVLEFFSRTAIIPSLKAHTPEHAIEELADAAAEHESISAVQRLKQAILDREHATGTAMEEGIAVPHARTDLVEKPLVVIGRSVSGIEWDSPDGKPAQFIFLILTPQGDNDSQVQILGHIARIMSEKEMQNKFSDAADESTLWNIVHQAFGDQVVKKRKR